MGLMKIRVVFCLAMSVLSVLIMNVYGADLLVGGGYPTVRPSNTIYKSNNLGYIKFHGLDHHIQPNGELVDNRSKEVPSYCDGVWQETEIKKWNVGIGKAVSSLPEDFLRRITEVNQKRISFAFYINHKTWETAHPDLDKIYINLSPSIIKPKWMTWETFPKNGFSTEEQIWITIHELFHVYEFSLQYLGGSFYEYVFNELEKELIQKNDPVHYYFSPWPWRILREASPIEGPSTLYGEVMGEAEDFADSGALYVLWPEYLKDHFPVRYQMIKKLIGQEYTSFYTMPESIRSKLNIPDRY